jgi:hypothetical protein
MPIYRDDAASLESHDRLRFSRLSDLDAVDNRGIDAGQVEGQHGPVLRDGNRALQDAGITVLEQNEIDGSPDGEMPGGQRCPPHATNPASNDQNGQSSPTAAHDTARGTQTRRTWRAKFGAIRVAMVQRENEPERRSCQVTRPLVEGMRWMGKRCMCQDKDEDGANEEPIRQGIRLVQV